MHAGQMEEACDIDIKSVGLRWVHPGGFIVDRPGGSGDYAFMQWLTPAILRIGDTMRQERPGGCIVYRPDDRQWFGSDVFTPFGNNWFHFHGPLAAHLLEECQIPLNRPLYLRNPAFIEPALGLFLRESMAKQPNWRRMLSAHACAFLIELGRSLRDDAARPKSARNMEMLEKFEAFRDAMKDRCAEPWTLARMAGELYLSTSRFSNLYREFFGAKPMDDLIRMRINLGEYYLGTTNMPVGYIAGLCGFADTYYFSRQFKAKTGKTASSFRAGQQ